MFWRKTDKPLDWQGRELCCDGCVHRELVREQRCRQRHVCVLDRSALRIEEFFNKNPELANEYLTHSYFEVRAAAAKYADVFRLTACWTMKTNRYAGMRRCVFRTVFFCGSGETRIVKCGFGLPRIWKAKN